MNENLLQLFHLCAAGGFAGGIGVSIVYPIDLVKTRMQNQRGSKSKYLGSIDCARQTIKREGILGLYRGLRPQILGVAPEKAIKLTVNDIVRSLYQDKTLSYKHEIGLNILSGSAAGLSQIIITNPLEICKIRLQVHGELHPTQPLSLIRVISELGFRGLYRGSRACMLRDIPFSAIYFPTYSHIRSELSDTDGNLTTFRQLTAGTLAGVCSSSITTPCDVVKTRLQVKHIVNNTSYDGVIDCYRKIIKTEGVLALFKGIGPRVTRSAPQFGITLYFYEKIKPNL